MIISDHFNELIPEDISILLLMSGSAECYKPHLCHTKDCTVPLILLEISYLTVIIFTRGRVTFRLQSVILNLWVMSPLWFVNIELGNENLIAVSVCSFSSSRGEECIPIRDLRIPFIVICFEETNSSLQMHYFSFLIMIANPAWASLTPEGFIGLVKKVKLTIAYNYNSCLNMFKFKVAK